MRNLRTTLVTTAIVVNLFMAGVAFAQSPPPTSGGKSSAGNTAGGKERTHTLSFEDELVEGANAKPELFYLFQKKNFNYKRLIKLRENFIPEMRKTSEEVQRGRSPN